MRPGKYYVRTVYIKTRGTGMSVLITRSGHGSKGAVWTRISLGNTPGWIFRGLIVFDWKGGSKVE